MELAVYSLHTDSNKEVPREIVELLHNSEDLFEEPTDLPPSRRGFDHHIPLLEGSQPVNKRPYRYPSYHKTAIEKMIQEMLDKGIIQPSSSPYSAPVVLVGKKDGSWRLCVDYRELNSQTIKNKFPIPVVEDLMDELGKAVVFTKLDLRAGYHQLRVHPPDIFKTAFKTHSGHYEYLVMPFGLTNAPSSFQHLMNDIFRPHLRNFVLVFFDDILMYSSSLQQHVTHLRVVFGILRQHSLVLKRSKCSFAVNKVEYLGHVISNGSISTGPAKVQAVAEWPTPTTLKQLIVFLGLAGYYQRFVKGFGAISRPLTELTRKDSFQWHEEATIAFGQLKKALTSAPVLALPDFTKAFIIETDASGVGLGAVLMQDHHPLAYISRTLSPKQQAMSVYEKELLAVCC